MIVDSAHDAQVLVLLGAQKVAEVRDAEGQLAGFEVEPEVDLAGYQTAAANYLKTRKLELKRRIDDQAEIERVKYITPGAGQAMTYSQKAEEARLCLSAASPDPDDYPMLAAEIGITASNLMGVAQVVADANAQWLQIGAAIESVRLATKKAIAEAETIEAAQVAADAAVWPSAN